MPFGMPPPMGGMPPGGMPPPMGGGLPGGGASAEDAFAALGGLVPKSPNPTQGLSKVTEALGLVHRIVMAIIPQVEQMNPKGARDLHDVGRRVLSVRSDIMKEAPLAPPPDLMLGMGGGGGPSLGAPSIPAATAGGGALPY